MQILLSQSSKAYQTIRLEEIYLEKLSNLKLNCQILRTFQKGEANEKICHFFWARPTSRPATPYYSLSTASEIYALRVMNQVSRTTQHMRQHGKFDNSEMPGKLGDRFFDEFF